MRKQYQLTVAKADIDAVARALTELGIPTSRLDGESGTELTIVTSLSKYELLYVKLAVRIKDLVLLDETVLYVGSKLSG